MTVADSADPSALDAPPSIVRRQPPVPPRWTLHGLNNGLIFGATYHGVRMLPRKASYAIGRAGTWLAWRAMRETRAAIAANLAPLFPAEDDAQLQRRALMTLRSYADDTIDFVRALSAGRAERSRLFELDEANRRLFTGLAADKRGIILVTGHYGNWEIGSLLVRDALDLPLTVVAMTEADPEVNRLRRRIRESLGVDTVEVRQSLDTALQIRRRLAANHIVAMLIDRHYARDRVAVSFLGQRAFFLRTPLLMAHATGAPVLPCFIERIGPGRFLPRPGTPVFVSREGPRDEAIAEAAQRVADTLAERIARHPHFWYHFYRYWDAQGDAYRGLA